MFIRGGEADKAQMDQVGVQKSTFAGVAALALFFASLVLGGALLWASAHPILRAGAVLAWLLSVGLGAVLNKGGIIQEQRGGESVRDSPLASRNGAPASTAMPA